MKGGGAGVGSQCSRWGDEINVQREQRGAGFKHLLAAPANVIWANIRKSSLRGLVLPVSSTSGSGASVQVITPQPQNTCRLG